jgi:uncharacterized protein (DUF305 family)
MGPSQEDAVMRADLGPGDVDFDKRFIDEMIVHHNGAIDMAHQAQQNSNRPEIKKMAFKSFGERDNARIPTTT